MPALVTGIAGVLTAFKATAIGTWLTGTFTGRLLASVALSALQGALIGQPADAGFTSQYTATGGTNPCSFIVGFSATAGQEICPPMTHGKAGKTPNAYLTYVIKLGDIPGQSLQGMQIDGAAVSLGSTPHPDYGLPVTGRYAGYAWFKYYNGSQTVADPMLLAKYGSYPERPWLADMIGINMCYVIMTFRYNRELFGGLPQGLWECGGVPFYDPRKDTTVGGSGVHRWATPATWETTVNPQVINYNIARGVTLPGLGVWGGDFVAEDLPLGNWFTAMNECDVLKDTPATAQFRAGMEIRVNMEPAGVMDEMNRASTGQFAETCGVLKVRVGGPGLPVLFITDGDIIVSKPQDYQPFPNAAGRQNGIEARYPDPAQVWQPIAAPPLYNATWEAEDGARRVTSLDLRACPFPKQCYRVMKSYITDARRNRSHGQTLPPDAAILEPLDVYGWTSDANSYAAKLFEVSQIADDLLTVLQQVSNRECDPADFVPPTGLVVPAAVSSAPAIPVAQTLPGWAVSGYIIADGASVARAPGGIGIWDGAELDDATGVQYQVRVFLTGQVIEEGFVSNVLAGRVVASKGILRNTGYEMRALLVVEGRASTWTAWTYFLSPDIAPVQVGDIGAGAVNNANLLSPVFGTAITRDPATRDISAWQDGQNAFLVSDNSGPFGDTAIACATNSQAVFEKRSPIDALKDHIATITIRQSSGSNTAFLLVAFEDAAGTNLDASAPGAVGWPGYDTFAYFGLLNQTCPAVWTTYNVAFGPNETAKIPTGATHCRIGWLNMFSAGVGQQRIKRAYIQEKVGNGQLGNSAVGLGNMVGGTYGGAAENPDPNFTDASAWSDGTPPNIVTITDGVAGNKAMRGVAGTDPYFYSKKFAVNPSKPYILRAIHRKSGTPDGNLYLRAYHFDAANAPLGFSENIFLPAQIFTTFTSFTSGVLTLPATTAFVQLVAIMNNGGTVGAGGYHELQAFRLDEQVGSGLIAGGAVTRPAILTGAVSDTVLGALIGPITTPVAGSAVLTIATGPIGNHQLWRAGLSLEHFVGGGQAQVLALQKRFKFAGAWGPWIEVATVSAGLAWDADGASTGFSATYDDAEFRLFVNSRTAVPANNLRNIRLTATNVVR